jgi:hypothetical protein
LLRNRRYYLQLTKNIFIKACCNNEHRKSAQLIADHYETWLRKNNKARKNHLHPPQHEYKIRRDKYINQTYYTYTHSAQNLNIFIYFIYWHRHILTITRGGKKLRGLSPRANYTDQATAACRWSDCQLLRLKGARWSAWLIPTAVFSVF